MKKIILTLLGALSLLYLLNPTAGIIEIIPDNLPFVGNLDEATASVFLLTALRVHGIDIPAWIKSPKDNTDEGIN